MAKKTHGGRRAGAGRKLTNPEGRTMTVTASVPEGLLAKLDALAEERDWSRSEAITQAVRRLVKNARQ